MTIDWASGSWVALAGAVNARDLGGLSASGGAVVARGRLLRADSLDACTADDVRLLRAAGIHYRLDLRANDEVGELTPEAPISAVPSSRKPLLVRNRDGGANPAVQRRSFDLVEFYERFITAGSQYTVEAITDLVDHSDQGVVFHCAGGKDRTGVLAALVLGLLGVSEADIVTDYALTQLRVEGIRQAMARRGYSVDDLPPALFEARPKTMYEFLRRLRGRYGSASGWATQAGVPESMVERLRNNVLT